jgi:DNA-binding NtrC family response regulator
MFKILVIEKDHRYREAIFGALSTCYKVECWKEDRDLFTELKTHHSDAVLLDMDMNGENGAGSLDLLRWIRTTLSSVPVIMTSSTEKAELVVTALRQGACDFIAKPFPSERVRLSVRKALENKSLRNEIDYLRHEQDVVYDFDQIVAFSPNMKEVIKTLRKFAKTDSTILITGETGTGKSFLSGSLHFNSNRRSKPFVKINCSNIPETLLESELFGHEKGAFTGADKLRVGRFEQANGGTLFLDEIGEMSLALQAKLLRVLEEKSFERIGGNKTIHSDVRIIGATNRDLEKFISQGRFREDLYYRINILSVMLPPLRARRKCIEPLAHLLLDKIGRSLKKGMEGFSPAVMEWMKGYTWPGNIRQLANTIERAVILGEGPVILREHVSMPESGGKSRNPGADDSTDPLENAPPERAPHVREPLELSEKKLLLEALRASFWIQKDAAEQLGISPRAMNYKIRKFGITHPRWRKNA